MEKPIIILGFGRSGTTWIADVISHAIGKLILFEPIHPSVIDNCDAVAYRRVMPGDSDAGDLVTLYRRVLTKQLRKPWLLRNHVPSPLRDVPEAALDAVWNSREIAGTKEIRANFLGPLLHHAVGAKIAYIVRDPRAVVASVVNRSNFWEFGWPGTFDLLMANTVSSPRFAGQPVAGLRRLALSAETTIEKVATMWAVTQVIALQDMKDIDAPVVRYEDLHDAPSLNFNRLFEQLGLDGAHLDQQQIYLPSVTTEKTAGGLYQPGSGDPDGALPFFWEDSFDPATADRIMTIAADFGIDLYRRDAARLSA